MNASVFGEVRKMIFFLSYGFEHQPSTANYILDLLHWISARIRHKSVYFCNNQNMFVVVFYFVFIHPPNVCVWYACEILFADKIAQDKFHIIHINEAKKKQQQTLFLASPSNGWLDLNNNWNTVYSMRSCLVFAMCMFSCSVYEAISTCAMHIRTLAVQRTTLYFPLQKVDVHVCMFGDSF